LCSNSIINDRNITIGSLIFYSNLKDFLLPIMQYWPSQTKTSGSILMHLRGDSISILQFNTNNNTEFVQKTIHIQQINDDLLKLLKQKEGTYEGIDIDGNNVIANTKRIPDMHWHLFNKSNTSEALAELHYRAAVVAIIVFILILLFSICIIWIYQNREHKRLQAEDEFETFFNNNIDLLCIADLNGIFKRLNPEWERVLGYSVDELIDKPYIDYVHPDDVAATIEASNKLSNNIKITNFTNRYLHKDGTYRYIEWRSYPGNKLVYATAHDITERLEIERKLTETNSLNTSILNNAGYGIIAINNQGIITTFNPTAEQMLGYKASEVIGNINPIIFHDNNEVAKHAELINLKLNTQIKPGIETIIEEARRGIESQHEWTYIRKDGSRFPVMLQVNVLLDSNKNIIGYMGIVADLTKQKQEEEILKEKEILLKDFHKVALLGAYRYNFQTNIWICTDVLDTIFGIDSSYVKDVNSWAEVIHPEYREIMEDYLTNHVLKEGNSFDKEYKIQRISDNQERWVHGKGEVENDINGNPLWLIGTIQDITERKKAEEILKNREHKYRMLFENMTNGFALHQMIYDERGNPIDYRYVEANPAFYKLTGIPDDIIVGKTIKEVLPNIEEHWIQIFGKVAKTGEPISYMNYASDLGKYYDTYVFCPEKDMFAVVFNDATERINSEIELKNSEKKFADLFNLSPIAVGVVKIKTAIVVDINQAHVTLTGYTKDEVLGKTADELNLWVNSEQRDRFIQLMRDIGEVNNLEVEIRAKDGSVKSCLFSAKPVVFNNEDCLIFSIHDITELKNTEEALKQARIYTDALLNSVPGLVYLYNEEGYMVSWNKRHETDTGYSHKEISHMHLSDWFKGSDKDLEVITTGVKKAIVEGSAFAEANLLKKNGKRVPYYFTAVGVKIEEKNYFTGIGIDITERKQYEEELNLLNQNLEKIVTKRTTQLQQANKDLESFAYSISHDLRSPLRHINWFSRILYSNIQNPNDDIKGYYEKINTASKRMSTMIDDLLSFSRLGRKELTLSKVDMNELIHEIIEQYKPDTENRHIDWRIQELPEISADRGLIRIAFENLISNAIKYTSKQSKAVIEIGANEITDNKTEIFFRDNGVGFDMAYAQKLFGVFQRLHTNEDFEGTGIGLANAKQVISKHNGLIRAEGKVNEGATFYITLPK
jgi:PAS domain S-box-containing protein